jgi:sulfite exporter TauE/SafE
MASAALLGVLLGLRHALEADHIVALTAIVGQGRGVRRALMAGLRWGIGHSITILVVGFAALALKISIPQGLALSLEFAVGIALVVLGIPLIRRWAARNHLHRHRHESAWHTHPHTHGEAVGHAHRHSRKPFFMGMLHGLAGSGALTVLVLATMESVAEGVVFLLLFGLGSILAMLVVGGLLGLSFGLAARSPGRIDRWLEGAVGMVSIGFGLYIMWRVGFAGALFEAATWV